MRFKKILLITVNFIAASQASSLETSRGSDVVAIQTPLEEMARPLFTKTESNRKKVLEELGNFTPEQQSHIITLIIGQYKNLIVEDRSNSAHILRVLRKVPYEYIDRVVGKIYPFLNSTKTNAYELIRPFTTCTTAELESLLIPSLASSRSFCYADEAAIVIEVKASASILVLEPKTSPVPIILMFDGLTFVTAYTAFTFERDGTSILPSINEIIKPLLRGDKMNFYIVPHMLAQFHPHHWEFVVGLITHPDTNLIMDDKRNSADVLKELHKFEPHQWERIVKLITNPAKRLLSRDRSNSAHVLEQFSKCSQDKWEEFSVPHEH